MSDDLPTNTSDLTVAGDRNADDALEQIGPYTLLRLLGEGGMGVVYLAEQKTPVERRVALKVIKLGMDTREVVARFEAERQALAVMDHPGIARVFDGGATDAGRPFFAMELVQGEPITQFCDRARLSIRDRIAFVIDVCRAVQHAHQKGIIHRDLKPSNVLVTTQDGRPAAKVIDFGIAKAIEKPLTDQTFATQAGQFVGTPAYMSPEQLGLTDQDIDTRADVYSLGVMLYELLAGGRPYEQQEMETGYSLIDAIRNNEPAKPSARLTSVSAERQSRIAASRQTDASALRKTLKGDLDWIVVKAIEKDRSRRYETVNTLAGDLQRYLGNEPVVARPPSRVYRAQKFVARHRIGVAASVAMLVLTVGSAGVIAVQAVRVATERDRATLEAKKATSINQFLQEMLSSANPWGEGAGGTKVVDALKVAEQRIDTSLASQPEVAAAVRVTIGKAYSGLGEYALAEPLLKAALEARRARGSPAPEVAEVLSALGAMFEDAGKLDDAARIQREALALLGAASVDNEGARSQVLVELATTVQQQGLYEEADRLAAEALEIRLRVYGPRSSEAADAYNALANIKSDRDDLPQAEALLEKAISIRRTVLGPQHPAVGTSLTSLGAHFIKSRDFEKALPILREAVEITRASLGPGHPLVAATSENLANVLYRLKRYPEAAERLEEVLAVRKQALGAQSMPVARTLFNIGSVYTYVGDYAKADQYLTEALDGLRRTLGADHPEIAVVLRAHAVLRERQGNLPAAEALNREALGLCVKKLGADHTQTATSHFRLGVVLVARQQYVDAETHLLRARAIREKVHGPAASLTQEVTDNLVKLYDGWGKLDKAQALRPK